MKYILLLYLVLLGLVGCDTTPIRTLDNRAVNFSTSQPLPKDFSLVGHKFTGITGVWFFVLEDGTILWTDLIDENMQLTSQDFLNAPFLHNRKDNHLGFGTGFVDGFKFELNTHFHTGDDFLFIGELIHDQDNKFVSLTKNTYIYSGFERHIQGTKFMQFRNGKLINFGTWTGYYNQIERVIWPEIRNIPPP